MVSSVVDGRIHRCCEVMKVVELGPCHHCSGYVNHDAYYRNERRV